MLSVDESKEFIIKSVNKLCGPEKEYQNRDFRFLLLRRQMFDLWPEVIALVPEDVMDVALNNLPVELAALRTCM